MSFLYPGFLFALIAVSIPIIIHLFNFRRYKKIYFTNVRFLKEVKHETQSRSRIKHLLVLLSRILAITALVFAFAQPYIPVDTKMIIEGDKVISVYIDNSFSMDATNNYGRLFEQAKKRALEIVSAYKPTDRFQLLTNDFEARHQRIINREEFAELLNEVSISPDVKQISEVITRQFEVLTNPTASLGAGTSVINRNAWLVSDFQRSISDFGQINNDTSVNVRLIPLMAQQTNNLLIDSCWFSSPIRQVSQAEKLIVRIKNRSDNSFENIPIKLFINNKQKALASFSIDPNATSDITLSFTLTPDTRGIQHAEILLKDYPVIFDDKFYFSFEVTENISILCINGEDESTNLRAVTRSVESKYLNSLFGNDDYFILSNSHEKNLDYSSFSNNQLIILNELKSISSGMGQELKRFIQNGGNVIVFPNIQSDLESYREFLSQQLGINYYLDIDTTTTKVEKINIEHEIYSGVFDPDKIGTRKIPDNIDLPIVSTHLILSKRSRTNEEYLLKMQNGDVFLGKYSFGKGKIYLSSVPLNTDFSNFPEHAIFVPVMYKIALHSQPVSRLFYTIGKDNTIEVNHTGLTGDHVFHITDPEFIGAGFPSSSPSFDIIPEHKIIDSKTHIYLHNQIRHAGNYTLSTGETRIAGVAFNYDRRESDLSCFNKDELIDLLKTSGLANFSILSTSNDNLIPALHEMNEGKRLWKLCIIFALAFLGIEVLLLRLWK